MSNSVDPDETAHMSRLIWIYAVCKSPLLSPVAVKEFNHFNDMKISCENSRYIKKTATCELCSHRLTRATDFIAQSVVRLTADPGVASSIPRSTI